MNLEKIAIENDIYLTYWIEYMKITYDAGWIYEQFMWENEWRKELLNEDIRSPLSWRKTAHGETEGDTLFEADEKRYSWWAKANEFVSPSELLYTFPYKSMGRKNPRFPPAREWQEQENIGADPSFVGMTKEKEWQTIVRFLNSIIRAFLLPRTKRSYEKLRRPEWVIISDTMLKFHDRDRRREIRDAIIWKNFDK